jgi:hypothetical protein
MNQPKDLSKLTPEELMEIAKLPLKDDGKKTLPPVKAFIVGDGIQEGEDLIPAALVYDRYQTWAKINNIEDVGIVKFFKDLQIYFTKIRKTYGYFYKMSQNGFDLSPEHIEYVNSKTVKRNSSGWKKRQKKKKEVQS